MRLYYRIIRLFLISKIMLLLASCGEEPKPAYLMPAVSTQEAMEITRTTALLSGEVSTSGEETITTLYFNYGTSEDLGTNVICDPASSTPSVRLNGLHPNTTYHYCLVAGNGYSSVQSTPKSFTTEPNRKPVIGNLRMINQGPVSITLQYDLTDDGGEPVTSTGFYFRTENNPKEQQYVITNGGQAELQARISGLQTETTYHVQAYATNSIGESRSEVFSFHTRQAVIVTTPGTLHEAIDEEEKYRYSTLSIAGPLNGTDLRFLREMLGRTKDGEQTPGQMNMLDLADASILSGGSSYDGNRFTENGEIGYGMFADCAYLQKLILPYDTKEIRENAFINCPKLTALTIPAATTAVMPSEHCGITNIEVAKESRTFCSIDGILYDQGKRHLVWFPEGKEELPSLPATTESIAPYAFRHCRMKQIELPETIKEIGKGAFYGAWIETIKLPEQMERIAAGLFQECRQLASVTLGSHTNYLSDYCFDGCPLQHLYVTTRDVPPMCQSQTFTEEFFKSCTLHVPHGCLSMYRQSPYWGKFVTIQEEN